jgi:hypothetical protein
MGRINRRQFTSAALATVGATVLGQSTSAAQAPQAKLPTVRWGKYEITRVLVGHNPLKGTSHFSRELDAEMSEWFDDGHVHGRELLRRCEQQGINTCQMGGTNMEELLQAHYAEGGSLQWIATFYSKPGEGKEELARILKMRPRPIGAQHFGATSDSLMREGKIDQALDTLKMLRGAGLLVGLCSHNHEVIDYAEQRGWDVDFYQCCFYHSTDGLSRKDGSEVFEESARRSMVKTIQQVSKPCIAFKVLGANRHCQTPAGVGRALRFALQNIKPTDVVLLGMWQKYKDQVAQNVGYVRKILATA